MQVTIKNKTYSFIDNNWTGVDKNGKVFKVTVKSLLEELNKVDVNYIPLTENNVLKESFTPLAGEWNDDIKRLYSTPSEDIDMSNVKVKKESVGLGDTISKVTSLLGVTPCENCKKRADVLNKMFPYLKKDIREMTVEEKELIDEVLKDNRTIKGKNVKPLFKLYNDLFGTKLQQCRCPGLLSKIVERLKVVRVEY